MRGILFIITIIFLFSCSNTKETITAVKPINHYIQKTADIDLKNWHHKDIYTDSIPGISLEKAYRELLYNKKADTIIVAVIDTELDINHEDLKGQIWTNTDEIPDNNIDDDKNGYVDDIHGWNFIGTNIGDTIPYSSYSYTRFIRKYSSLFENKTAKNIPVNQEKLFHEYQRAIKRYDKEIKIKQDDIATYKRIKDKYIKADGMLFNFFSNNSYTISQLDSLSEIVADSLVKTRIGHMKYYLKNNIDLNWVERGLKSEYVIINTLLNKESNDNRLVDGCSKDNLDSIHYGNNNIQGTGKINHGTQVMSILAGTRNNNIGTDGISNLLKVMSIGVSIAGDEFDKDIALAIRYAVDNGAKIINMSIGKEFSMHPDWVKEAIQYAESKDVLIVSSAGNKSYNLDDEFDYPDDYDTQGEYAQNFIKVGASSYKVDSTLVWLSSNYGKKNVDIFAPGHKIYSIARRSNTTSSGTSYASPIVAGIASLIRSYYPNLSAIEVKDIILKSGISYDIDVVRPYPYGEKQPEQKIPFQSMSKSGKIVNAYNALLLAEKVSKAKKKKRE